MTLHDSLWWLLGWVIFPLWLVAGFADWICHRRSRIERTSGPRESRLHLLMFAQIALPLLLALYFEISGLVLLVMVLALLAHLATSWWDTALSQPVRYISPTEQQVHGFMDLLPWFAFALIAILHTDAWDAWGLHRREQPMSPPRWAVLAGLAGAGAMIVEEYVRGRRGKSGGVR
jgi:hypothetical protein